MKNLINFFFSFDKLFKEKLVVPFFWLALIVWGLKYFAKFLDGISLDPLAKLLEVVGFFAEVLLVLILIRIVSELFVAIFRINDNLSPDGGKSELADIDPVAEARRAAEMAAARTREMTKSAGDKTKSAIDDVKHQVEDRTGLKTEDKKAKSSAAAKVSEQKSVDKPATAKTSDATAADTPAVKRGRGRPKGSKNKPKAASATTASKDQPVKRGRGRPKGSKNKPKTTSAAAAPAKRGPGRPKGSKNKTSSATKPGPKKGQPVPRDADGNLLKKDGTPRKKPGPKPKA